MARIASTRSLGLPPVGRGPSQLRPFLTEGASSQGSVSGLRRPFGVYARVAASAGEVDVEALNDQAFVDVLRARLPVTLEVSAGIARSRHNRLRIVTLDVRAVVSVGEVLRRDVRADAAATVGEVLRLIDTLDVRANVVDRVRRRVLVEPLVVRVGESVIRRGRLVVILDVQAVVVSTRLRGAER